MESMFYYPVTLHRGDASGLVVAPAVGSLPLVQHISDSVLILTSVESPLTQGMYVWDGSRWRWAMSLPDICMAIIEGDSIDVYFALQSDVTDIPTAAHAYRNGLPWDNTTLPAGLDVMWAVRAPLNSASGDVSTVNGQGPDAQGNVAIGITNIPGLQAALDSAGQVKTVNGATPDGSGNVVIPVATATVRGTVKGGGNVTIAADGTLTAPAYTLPVATSSVLGGVKQGSNITIAGDGTISAAAAPVISVSGQTGAVVVKAQDNNAATGTSLIVGDGSGTGIIKLKTLVAGANITLSADPNGNVTVASTSAGSLTAVNSEGTGTSLVDNNGSSGGVATIKSLAAGSNVTITQAGDGKTLTIAANQVLNPATTTTIGGVIVKAGLAVDGSGNLSLAAPTGAFLGGVKAGTGITIAADGTISASGAVASVSGQTGAVVVSATDNNAASGTSLIANSGATTANIKLKTIVAGSNITLAADPNGNLQISSTLAATVTSFATGTSGQLHGDIVFAAGQAISLSNTGNTIQINGTGVPEAPNDSNLYARQNMGWTQIPATSNPIVAVNGQTGTGAILLVEASPPANTAVIKSLVAGTNVSITENAGLLTIAASIPAGTVATVNGKTPDGSGNVALAASDVNAVPVAGNVTMTGPLNMGTQTLSISKAPTVATDAVPLSYITGLVIDGGVIG